MLNISKTNEQPDRWSIWLSCSIALTFIPTVFLTTQNYMSLFLYLHLARVAHYWDTGKLGIDSLGNIAGTSFSLRLGTAFILMLIGKVSTLTLEQIPFLGIGSIVLPALYFAITKKLTGSNALSFLIAIYIGYNHAVVLNQYNVFLLGWTHILFLTTVLVLQNVIQRGKSVGAILMIFVLFLSCFLTYHTTSVWIVLLIVSFSVLVSMAATLFKPSASTKWTLPLSALEDAATNNKRSLISIGACMSILYIAFDPIFYRIYLPYFNTGSSAGGVNKFYNQLMLFLGLDEPILLPPFEMTVFTSKLGAALTLCILGLIVLPIAIDGAMMVLNAVKKRTIADQMTPVRLFWFSMLLTFIPYGLIYSIYVAGMNLKLVHILLPFSMIISLTNLAKLFKIQPKAILIPWCSVLTLIVIWGFIEYVQSPISDTAPEHLGTSVEFLKGDRTDRVRILGDVNTYSRILFKGEQIGAQFNHRDIDTDSYVAITNLNSMGNESDVDYLVIDVKNINKPIWGYNWDNYEPISDHLEQIQINNELSKVYDNGELYIYTNDVQEQNQ